MLLLEARRIVRRDHGYRWWPSSVHGCKVRARHSAITRPSGCSLGSVGSDQRREEIVLFRVLVDVEAELVGSAPRAGCSRCARRSGSSRRPGSPSSRRVIRHVLRRRRGGARRRRACRGRSSRSCRARAIPAAAAPSRLREAEVGRAVGHHRVLPRDDRRVQERVVHRPLRARAAPPRESAAPSPSSAWRCCRRRRSGRSAAECPGAWDRRGCTRGARPPRSDISNRFERSSMS